MPCALNSQGIVVSGPFRPLQIFKKLLYSDIYFLMLLYHALMPGIDKSKLGLRQALLKVQIALYGV